MKILDGLWQVGGPGLTSTQDAAVYLVAAGGEAAVIDAGCGESHHRLAERIRDVLPAGTTIRYLFLTHCHFDHAGGASGLREIFACSIVAHEKDAVFLEQGDSAVTAASWYGSTMPRFHVDHTISVDRESFTVGNLDLTAVHCPGHSPGSIVVFATIQGKKVLFGQDVHGPLHPSLLSDPALYAHSLRQLLKMEADILCEGHFGIIRGRQEVREFISAYLER